MSSSLVSGPYASAVSIKFTPSSTARLENFQRVLSISRPTPDAFACNAHRAKTKSIDSEVAAQIKRRICSHV